MYLKVKVTPGASKDGLEQIKPDTFRATVKVPAKNNLANQAVAKLLAERFALSVKKIRLISGHHSPSKIFDLVL